MIIKTENKSAIKNEWKARKKIGERKFAEFFIERLNQIYNLNYRVIPNIEEANDVDIRAVAEENKVLDLQLKTGEPGMERFLGTRIKQGSGMAAIDGNIENDLSQIIKAAEQKYPDKNKLILLITGRFLFNCDGSFAQYLSEKLANSAFMGVYLVRFHAGLNINPPFEDYVVAIKDIFGNHGKIF